MLTICSIVFSLVYLEPPTRPMKEEIIFLHCHGFFHILSNTGLPRETGPGASTLAIFGVDLALWLLVQIHKVLK